MLTDAEAISAALANPFDPRLVKWRPITTSGDRALASAYVDARTIQSRLDVVVGAANWSDDYDFLPGGSVVCRLRLRFNGEWVMKCDVGSPSEQPDEGDKLKAAVSDALKRAAVKFGIARYLYRLPMQWVDWDAQKKRFAKTPTLPDWALPRKEAPAQLPAANKQQQSNGDGDSRIKTGAELEPLVQQIAVKWEKAGYCTADMVIYRVGEWARSQGCHRLMADWPADLVSGAGKFLRDLLAEFKAPAPEDILKTIQDACEQLGWSASDREEYLANANLLQPGEIPNAFKAEKILTHLEEMLHDQKEVATDVESKDEIPF